MTDNKNNHIVPINKTKEEWKKELSTKEFHILREKGTEPQFTSKFEDFKKKGTYICAGCNLPLFSSSTKYNSKTGWPSFYQPVKDDHVQQHSDQSFGMSRVEVVCARCGGHLGHIFPDGPKPTGKRYCINSISLDFISNNKTE